MTKHTSGLMDFICCILSCIAAISTIIVNCKVLGDNLLGIPLWLIIAVFVALTVVFFVRYREKSRNGASSGEVAASKSYPPEKYLAVNHPLVNYREVAKNRDNYNLFSVESGKFILELLDYGKLDTGEQKVGQIVIWKMHCSHSCDEPVNSFKFLVTIGFTSSMESLDIKATLRKDGRDTIVLDPPKIEIIPNSGNMRLLIFDFPEGVRCIRGEIFQIELIIKWKTQCFFGDITTYFTHPRNYGKHIKNLYIEVINRIDSFKDRECNFYEVDLESLSMTPVKERQKLSCKKTVACAINKVGKDSAYLIELSK